MLSLMVVRRFQSSMLWKIEIVMYQQRVPQVKQAAHYYWAYKGSELRKMREMELTTGFTPVLVKHSIQSCVVQLIQY